MLGTVLLFSGQPQDGGNQQQQNKNDSNYQVESEKDYQPKPIDRGYFSEIMYASETWAFWPTNYSTVYLRPFGEGLFANIAVITHRPKMLIYQGALTHSGVKFTTLFPAMHFIYVRDSGTGHKMQIIYQPQADSQKLSQAKRVRLALDYAKEADKKHYERLEKVLEKRKQQQKEQEQKFNQNQNNNQQQ